MIHTKEEMQLFMDSITEMNRAVDYIKELEHQNAELLEALKEARRHGLIEKDGYERVVKLVGQAIKNAE